MKEAFLEALACPGCRAPLRLGFPRVRGVGGEIRSGTVDCSACRIAYPIRNYIPRFVPSDNYARSFGVEWRRHARTQLDSANGTRITRERWQRATGWLARLDGQRILEAGCGAGRFTEIALEAGCELVSFDLSEAVDTCLENHGPVASWHLFQGDLVRLPLRDGFFDKVFCLGVLQSCPDEAAAFRALLPPLRAGGELAIDVYEKTFKIYVTPRFWLRLVTSRMDADRLYTLVVRSVPRLLPLKTWLKERVPVVGRYLATMVPVAYYNGVLPLSEEQLLEWSILDTFDILAPRYEHRVSLADVRGWFARGFAWSRVDRGPNGIVAVGEKAAAARGGRGDGMGDAPSVHDDPPPDADSVRRDRHAPSARPRWERWT